MDEHLEARFKKLFDEQSSALRNYVFYLSGDLGLAKDLTQESFLKLWKQRRKVDWERAPSLLFQIAKNLYFDHQKHQKVIHRFAQGFQPGVDRQDPNYQLEVKEFHQMLLDVIDQMPESSREVFLLNRIEKLKYREIAERLEVSVKTIEKRMGKALIIIRAFYAKIGK